jgi:hypothetical protein
MAIKALEDISLVKRLAAKAEMNAVATARRGGKSWAEIAVALGSDADTVRSMWSELDGT